MTDLTNTLRITSPINILIGLIMAWLITFRNIYLFILAGYFINTFGLNYMLKVVFATLFGNNCFMFRPINYPVGMCDIYFTPESGEGNPTCRPVAFPSTHGQAFGFIIGFLSFYYSTQNYDVLEMLIAMFISLVYLYGILILQYFSGCETFFQLLTGVLIGIGIGIGWFYLYYYNSDAIDNKTF